MPSLHGLCGFHSSSPQGSDKAGPGGGRGRQAQPEASQNRIRFGIRRGAATTSGIVAAGHAQQAIDHLAMGIKAGAGILGGVVISKAVLPDVVIQFQQVAEVGGFGGFNLVGRQFVKEAGPFQSDRAAVGSKASIHLNSRQTDQPQRLGVILGPERKGFLGLGVAGLEFLRDGCAVVIDRSTAGQAGMSGHG